MTIVSHMRRRIGAGVMVAALVGLTAALAAGLIYPEQVPSPALGPDWQCTRLAFVFTSCTRVVGLRTAAAENAAAAENGAAPSCRRPAAWLSALGFLH